VVALSECRSEITCLKMLLKRRFEGAAQLKPPLPVTAETAGTASGHLEEYKSEYKKLANDRAIAVDYVPEPYELKWLFFN